MLKGYLKICIYIIGIIIFLSGIEKIYANEILINQELCKVETSIEYIPIIPEVFNDIPLATPTAEIKKEEIIEVKQEQKEEVKEEIKQEIPVCSDKTTIQLPANPHVVRNGDKALVNFFITEGDSANIYYRVVGNNDWQYSVPDVKPNGDRFVSYLINDLNRDLSYDFGIQQKMGCGGGQLVESIIVDPPALGEVFRFSYWQWSK